MSCLIPVKKLSTPHRPQISVFIVSAVHRVATGQEMVSEKIIQENIVILKKSMGE